MGVIYKNGVRYSGGIGTGDGTQKIEMPTPSSINVSEIVQYVGPTTLEYINGYYYKCIEDKTTTPTSYKWELVEVQSMPQISVINTHTLLIRQPLT